MTVYIDNMYLLPMGQYGRMKMSHMVADTREELDAMADRIGVARRWLQYPNTWKEHYDIAMVARRQAVANGAVEISVDVMAAMNCRRRKTGVLGLPHDALEWFSSHKK